MNSIKLFDNKKYNFSHLINKIYETYFNYKIELEDIHDLLNTDLIDDNTKKYYKTIPLFGINDRKSIFIDIYHKYYDNNNEFKDMYINFIQNIIKPTYYPDETHLVIQKTPNIRLHLPNCTNIGKRPTDPNEHIIGVHKDVEFGHSENEMNYILPITKMYDTNSLYFENGLDTTFEDFSNLKLDTNEYAQLYLNQLRHYNKINTTNKTRISMDFRIIPFSKYKETQNKTETCKMHLTIGNYFILV